MIKLAENDILPKELLYWKNTPVLICVSCAFGKAKKISKNSSKPSNYIRYLNDNTPGKKVSTDQLLMTQPGLVPQSKESLTSDRITAATMAVDHFTDIHKIMLMRSTTQQEKLDAKLWIDNFFYQHGRGIQSWHVENGRYAEEYFNEAISSANQKINFCGVVVHHQNGITETAIKQSTLQAGTLLLYSKRYWPSMITTILWPFVLLIVAENVKILGISEFLDIKREHTCVSPIYILDRIF